MSRRKTKAEEIRNPEHYFNKYIAMEIRKDKEKDDEYYEMFDSLEELTDSGRRTSHEKLMLVAVNVDDGELEAALCESTLFGWIDYIENPTLHKAIRVLPDEDKFFLTLRFKNGLSQKETAEVMRVVQSSISRREKRLKKYFREIFEKTHRKS